MKRYILGALGSLSLASQLLGQTGTYPKAHSTQFRSMPNRVDSSAPVVLQHAPTQVNKPMMVPMQSTIPQGVIVTEGCDDGCGRVGLFNRLRNIDWSFGCRDRDFNLVGGAELLYLRPHFDSNPSLVVSQTDTLQLPGSTSVQVQNSNPEFAYDWSASPRLWIGVQNDCGVGFRGRWFHYDQAADPASALASGSGANTTNAPTAPFPEVSSVTTAGSVSGSGLPIIRGTSPGTVGPVLGVVAGVDTANDLFIPTNDGVFASSSLFLDVWDAEFTSAGQVGCWNLLGSAGARYAYMEQTYNVFHPGVTAVSTGAPGVSSSLFRSDTLLSRQTFNGIGPTVALQLLRGLGDGRVSLYGSGRGAVLFGRGRQSARLTSFSRETSTTVGAATTTADLVTGNYTTSSGWDILPVFEAEAGLNIQLSSDNANMFLRPAFVGQAWFDGGSASSRSVDFGLVGFSLTAGVGF